MPVRSAVVTTRQQSSIDVHSGTSTIAWHPDSMAAQAIGICTSTSVVTATASGSTSRSMRSKPCLSPAGRFEMCMRATWLVTPAGRIESNSGCSTVLVEGVTTPSFMRQPK